MVTESPLSLDSDQYLHFAQTKTSFLPVQGPDLTRSEREMLKAIYRLAKLDGSAHTGDLAGALGISPTGVARSLADSSNPW